MLSDKDQTAEQINKAEKILIAAPADENPDALAGGLALFLFLKKMGKEVDFVLGNIAARDNLNFLPGFGEIAESPGGMQNLVVSLNIAKTKVDRVKYVVNGDRLDFIITPKEGGFTGEEVASCVCDYKYDLAIAVGAPDLESLGKVYEENPDFFFKTPVINIDNDSGNEGFGQVNLTDLTAVSLAEILLPLFKSLEADLVNEDATTCLLAGIIGKTRNFRNQMISPRLLETTSELIALGARKDDIINRLYRSRTFNVLKLWGRVLARLESGAGGRLVWSVLNRVDFQKTESDEKDLSEVIEELISNVPTARLIVLIFETGEDNKTKGLVYSAKSLNSLELAADFSPRGSRHLASFELDEPLPAGEKVILGRLEEKLKAVLEKE